MDVLARSAYERYREACGQTPNIRDGLYPGDYLVPVGEAIKKKFGESLLGHDEGIMALRRAGIRSRSDVLP